MELQPRIEKVIEKKLIGRRLIMSFLENKTKELWQDFMSIRKEIKNNIGTELYSIEVYNDPQFFKKFNPEKKFEKWAAIQVKELDSVPPGMETIVIPDGLYAVFLYKGTASEAAETFRYIHSFWIPNSVYALDDRPHFALMGEKYKNEDPDSEEEIWIPIKNK
jgi:AraC family transcriptional regulator